LFDGHESRVAPRRGGSWRRTNRRASPRTPLKARRSETHFPIPANPWSGRNQRQCHLAHHFPWQSADVPSQGTSNSNPTSN
jgi:hypothetical protein